MTRSPTQLTSLFCVSLLVGVAGCSVDSEGNGGSASVGGAGGSSGTTGGSPGNGGVGGTGTPGGAGGGSGASGGSSGHGGVSGNGGATGGAGGATGGTGGATGGTGGATGGTGGTGTGVDFCTSSCPSGSTPYRDLCISLDDPTYGCGSGTPCMPDYEARAAHRYRPHCAGGACVLGDCLPGWANCDGDARTCETDITQPDNCAACNVQCGSNELCGPSGCTTQCQPPLGICGARCVDLTKTTNACGSCATNCADDFLDRNVCVSGACQQLPCGNGECGFCDPEKCVSSGTQRKQCTSSTGQCATCESDRCLYLGNCEAQSGSIHGCGSCGNTCPVACSHGGCVTPEVLTTSAGPVSEVVVDDTHIYWTEQAAGTVYRLAKPGGTPELIAFNQSTPADLQLTSSYIVWLNRGTSEIARSDKAGGNLTTLVTSNQVYDVDSNDSTVVYLPYPGTSLYSIPIAGGTPSLVANFPPPGAAALSLVGSDVYTATAGQESTLSVVAVGGGTSQPVSQCEGCGWTGDINIDAGTNHLAWRVSDRLQIVDIGQSCPGGFGPSSAKERLTLAPDETAVYTVGTATLFDYELAELAAPTARAKLPMADSANDRRVAIDANYIYWGDGNDLVRMAR